MKIIFRQLFDRETSTYTYLLADAVSKEALLIDTVKENIERDLRLLQELGLTLRFLLETHVHADHITAAASIRDRTGAKVGLSEAARATCADILLTDGQELQLGQLRLKAIATPGHTDSCMSYLCEGMVFTGDALFVRDAGRTDFQQGSNERLYESITKKLFSLPGSTLVYPGHDYNGNTVSTIDEERTYNSKAGFGRSMAEFKEAMSTMKLSLPKRIHEAVPANLQCGRV